MKFKLPQHPALSWISLMLIAYLLGDLTCAVVERQLGRRPQRQASQAAAPAAAALNQLKNRGELAALLTARVAVADPQAPILAPGGPQPGPPQPGLPAPGDSGAGNATALPQLLGTMEGQGQALAMLQMGQETQVVGVGEEWLNFKVVEVGAFEARLRDRRNQEYVISMGIAGATTVPVTQIQGPVNQTPPVGSPQGQLANAGPYRTIRELRQELDNRSQWVRNILVQPVMRSGESIGVQVNYNNPSNPFARLGIQSGDIVLSLNQKPARGVEDLGTIVGELRNSTTMNFKLERGGQEVPLTVTLEP